MKPVRLMSAAQRKRGDAILKLLDEKTEAELFEARRKTMVKRKSPKEKAFWMIDCLGLDDAIKGSWAMFRSAVGEVDQKYWMAINAKLDSLRQERGF